ncbi:protein FAR1-RELATED SEQUENCE 1-like [Silene latifolia]|uniref:protein FAR1-RELATED SEQUENCE 1-like n=1 Tax=Silene latifolia TaxID=37657 RepID=UPI003D78A34E
MQKTYQVVFNSTSTDAECSCKLFNRKGIICRHIIWVFSGKQVRTLPDKYILMRWTKNAQKIPLYGSHGELLDDFDATDVRKLEMCKLWLEFYSTISLLRTMPNNQITDLADTLKQFRVKLNPQAQSMTKEQELKMLLGCSSSTEVRILPPRQAKNKGSGKRMILTKQQCIAKAEKPKRLCKNCKQLANHDKRNCPHPFVPDIENQGSSDDD